MRDRQTITAGEGGGFAVSLPEVLKRVSSGREDAIQTLRAWIRPVRHCLALTLVLPGFWVRPAFADTAWVDRVEAELQAISGQPFQVDLPEGHAFGDVFGPYVYYAPLSLLWALEAETLEESAGARVIPRGTVWRVGTGSDARIELRKDHGPVEALPVGSTLEALPQRHHLAIAYDLLLSLPLSRPVGGLPVGSQFDVTGQVRLPTGVTGAARWISQGETILIEHADGRVYVELVSSLYNAPSEPGEAP